jgi:hypothetical protein
MRIQSLQSFMICHLNKITGPARRIFEVARDEVADRQLGLAKLTEKGGRPGALNHTNINK